MREMYLQTAPSSSRQYTRTSLVGQTFGKLKVIRRAILGYSDVFWRCECECGSGIIRYKKTSDLLKGLGNLSCGCQRQKHKYELADLPLYIVFKAMKQRCYNPKNKDYPRYGGRGIYICDEWLKDPRLFISWAKSKGYKRGLEIDRSNNDGPYSPDNCRWVPRAMQNRNTSANIKLTVGGETHLCSEWARLLGLSKCRISDKLRESGEDECIHYITERLKHQQSNSTVSI